MKQPVSADIPIHDIAPLLEIHEYSIYWFMILIAVIFMIVFIAMKQLRKKRKLKEQDERVARYETFKRIDMSDPKTAAYAMGKQGAFFAHDNEETKNTYQILFKRLEPYKYARNVEAIDKETLALYLSYQNRIIV